MILDQVENITAFDLKESEYVGILAFDMINNALDPRRTAFEVLHVPREYGKHGLLLSA